MTIKGAGPLCEGAGMTETVFTADGQGLCPMCGWWVAVTQAGCLRQHRSPDVLAAAADARKQAATAWRKQRQAQRRAGRYVPVSVDAYVAQWRAEGKRRPIQRLTPVLHHTSKRVTCDGCTTRVYAWANEVDSHGDQTGRHYCRTCTTKHNNQEV